MRGLVMALLVAAAGCTVSPQDEVADVAEAYCKCVLPGDKTCVSQFESFITSVSDACQQCVFEHQHRCASMQVDCTQLCIGNVTTP
jgi:hypothetical protein